MQKKGGIEGVKGENEGKDDEEEKEEEKEL